MKKKKLILFIIPMILLLLVGAAYAFFDYYRLGVKNYQVIAGEVSLKFTNGNNTINLSNIFPETKEEARARDDNYITFTLSGINTTLNKDIFYEIMLNEGDEEENKTRFTPKDLVFDLLEIDSNGEETYLVDAMRYSDFNEKRIWVETVDHETVNRLERTYKLRMWLSEDVIISDTYEGASYSTSVFKNSYASVKVSVYGDFVEKNIPLVVDNEDTYVENNKSYFYATISNYHYSNDVGVNANDNMKLIVTSSNPNVLFSYKDSEGNVVEDTTKKLDINYLFNKKKDVTVQVFVTSENDANAETELRFQLIQNGEIIQDYYENFTVYGNNFCLNNGFNKLYDCILASDSLATNLSTAKVNIEAKGEPNLNDTAPTYTYVEDITYDVSNVYSVTGTQFYFGDSYEFNATDGTFKLINTDGSNVIIDTLSDNYKNYYTCGATIHNYICSTIYRVDTTSVEGTTYTIKQGDRITYKISSSIRSEVGLYKLQDDYGDSYVFRGDVTNNNVYFGGYYWKIIRTNGDESIRLIYNGESKRATGNSTSINNNTYTYSDKYPKNNSPIGPRSSDSTYVGYMYGKNFALQTSEWTIYTDFQALTKYYFADGYEFDEENEVFKLKKVNLEPVAGTFAEMKDNYKTYPYTCKSTNENGVCEVLLEMHSWVNETQIYVKYISYSSKDKDSTRTNEHSSNAKMQLENWYETNLVVKKDEYGRLITDYIVDGTFCNNRSTTNSGYLLTPTTYYSSYINLNMNENKVASLKCNEDSRDKFSYTTTKGNGLLKYPIALITADEVALAGGKYDTKNENYYLRSNGYFFTMTPSVFHAPTAIAYMWFVYPVGTLHPWSYVAGSNGLRPVINLSKDVLISSGDGTVDNPFQLKLA